MECAAHPLQCIYVTGFIILPIASFYVGGGMLRRRQPLHERRQRQHRLSFGAASSREHSTSLSPRLEQGARGGTACSLQSTTTANQSTRVTTSQSSETEVRNDSQRHGCVQTKETRYVISGCQRIREVLGAFVLVAETGAWHQYSDQAITAINTNNVLAGIRNNGYLLFFESMV